MKLWFSGFTEGLREIPEDARNGLMRCCARRCADSGAKDMYLRRFHEAGDDLDAFFDGLLVEGCVRGRVVRSGREYEIVFPQCLCDLYTQGYTKDGCICECSRQSLLYVMQSLAPKRRCDVVKLAAILCGDEQCLFRITFDS